MARVRIPNWRRVKGYADASRRQLGASSTILKFARVLVGVLFPLAEAVIVNLWTETLHSGSAQAASVYKTILIIVGLVHIVLFLISLWADAPLPQFLVQFDEQSREADATRERFAVSRRMTAAFREATQAAKIGIDTIDQLQPDGPAVRNADDLRARLETFLRPWLMKRTEIFWFSDGAAHHSFAVYIFNPKSSMLEVVFRYADDRLRIQNRPWALNRLGILLKRDDRRFLVEVFHHGHYHPLVA